MAIRVFDPGARVVNRAYDGGWDNTPHAPFDESLYTAVLGYTFLDINPDIPAQFRLQPELSTLAPKAWPQSEQFTSKIAEHLLQNFKKKYEGESILLHCNAGLSRSPGIAKALVEIFKLEPEWQGRAKQFAEVDSGNSFVYRLLCEAATYLDIWAEE